MSAAGPTALAVSLAFVLAAPANAAGPDAAADSPSSEPSTQDRVKDLYYEGAARYSASDYPAAIEAFTEALKVDTAAGARASVRGALLQNLAQAHVRAYRIDSDATHLRTAVDIYQRFLEEADKANYKEADVKEARAQIEKLEARIAELEAAGEPPEPSPPPAEPEPPADRPPADSKPPVRGIVLTSVGGAVVLGGVGVLIYGTTFRRDAEEQLEQVDDPPELEQEFLDQETRKGRIVIGVGAGVAVAGAALVAVGVVDLVRHRKRSQVAVAPWLLPRGAGLGLAGRF